MAKKNAMEITRFPDEMCESMLPILSEHGIVRGKTEGRRLIKDGGLKLYLVGVKKNKGNTRQAQA